MDARSEEACGYRGQTGVLVTSETTIRLPTEGGSAEIDGQALRVLRYETVGGESGFVLRRIFADVLDPESPRGDFDLEATIG